MFSGARLCGFGVPALTTSCPRIGHEPSLGSLDHECAPISRILLEWEHADHPKRLTRSGAARGSFVARRSSPVNFEPHCAAGRLPKEVFGLTRPRGVQGVVV